MRPLMRMFLASLLLVGCATQKVAVDDDFSDLYGQDEKSDAFSYRMKIVGSLDYGATSASVKYTSSPRYPVAWLLDNSFHVLASNDDADTTTFDSHISLLLPANASATHYIVFRDYSTSTAHFTVELTGGLAYQTECTTDDDCVAVFAGGCCPDGRKAAVRVGSEDDYAAATTCDQPPAVCPLHVILETRVAQCDYAAHQCAMIAPEDIRCGGFVMHPHQCPAHYECHITGNPDVPGSCAAL